MNVAVVGGTRQTGRLVVEQALAAGHKVRVLARDPDALAPRFGLELIKGDALDGGRVMAALTGCEAVVVALGHGKGSPPDLCSRATELVVQAAVKTGARKLVVVSAQGAGESRGDISWVFQLISNLLLKQVMADKGAQERLVMASPLDWTIVRPTGLTDGPATGQAAVGTGAMMSLRIAGKAPKGRVSRADVAAFCVDALTNPERSRSAWFVTT